MASVSTARKLRARDDALPEPLGLEFLGGDIPQVAEPWPATEPAVRAVGDDPDVPASRAQVDRYLRDKLWVAPEEEICFLTDIHADTDAFWRSTVASGGVAKTGPGAQDFELTPAGRRYRWVLGGDLFDKGPANLPLLEAIGSFVDAGAKLTLCVGNHDIRTFLGILHADATDVPHAHLFARMGRKAMTLFHEIFERHVAGSERPRISDAEFRERYFPDERWFEGFPEVAQGMVPPPRIEKELRRVREKMSDIEHRCAELGMTLSDLHATIGKSHEIFTQEGAPHRWILDRMQLSHRAGSTLFVHAGLDDTIASWIRSDGIEGVNERFRKALVESPFELYNGPLGNVFRTKYRDLDRPLTGSGLRNLHKEGIHAIVHGHRNVRVGQRLMFRAGLLNFECDASIDRNTRRLEGLDGPGAAATLLLRDGRVLGISTDHPAVKIFDPKQHCSFVTSV